MMMSTFVFIWLFLPCKMFPFEGQICLSYFDRKNRPPLAKRKREGDDIQKQKIEKKLLRENQ